MFWLEQLVVSRGFRIASDAIAHVADPRVTGVSVRMRDVSDVSLFSFSGPAGA